MVSQQTAESFVFMKEEALPLRYRPLAGQSIELRNDSDPSHPGLISYEEGIDFVVDYDKGLISRTKGSRIPDGSLHPMYGVNEFDHTLYPDYSNREYTVYADYATEGGLADESLTIEDVERSGLLGRTIRKLAAGEEVLYVVYGDSISTGGEASTESLAYFGRFAEMLQGLYPEGRIRIVNKSIGGEASDGGASRVNDDVVPLKPDLVSIGYGMNDQNKHEHGNYVPLEDYDKNHRHIIDAIRRDGDSDIVLVTPCEPNPHWRYTSGDTHRYAEKLRQLGAEYGIGVADAHTLWCQELAAGKTPESLLLNNINHPNDYGHWIYSRAFVPMLKK
ncbi:SGNH/GDSL hydrolase family protein [Cohnella silvisoli]|uniref:GDSL-type esterase/lipase family protein n=1 Tax=Cohnella silvisoli TaxID=2873699 RepID=A0ABV1KQF5_9BACL|nr:GDSL-type esterase/lipase family protein [Cohnella silvisoli]MCD9022023.1 hypothetical protein [Cohnella silvisoli]